MYDKLVIFYTANYCQKIKSYFGVDDLLARGLHVEFWDLSDLTAHEHLTPVFSPGLVLKKFSKFEDLESEVSRYSDMRVLYLSFVNFATFSFRVYRILSKYDAHIAYCTTGSLPGGVINSKWKNVFRRLKNLFSPFYLWRYFKCAILRICCSTNAFTPVRYLLLCSGSAGCDYKVAKTTKVLGCNTGDYNQFLALNKEPNQDGNYIVFIDQYLPFHNDITLAGASHINAEKYYAALNALLDIMEKKYQCKVIVCAHPSAVKYSEYNYFNGRRIVYNETASRIKNAIGVIAGDSTALSFAVMAKRPILLIASDEILAKYVWSRSRFKNFQQILNIHYENIDHLVNPHFKEVDPQSYETYNLGYLTTKVSMNSNNSEIIASIAKNDYHRFLLR
jgi:hypothetical protein